MNELLNKTVTEIAGLEFMCSCGKTHNIDIKDIRIGSNILGNVVDSLQKFSTGTVLLIADNNTYEVAGRQVADLIKTKFLVETVIFQDEHLHPDEEALNKLRAAINPMITAIVVVGSGTLNDLARYLSYESKVPYIVVCTAPSMDGYASMVAPLITKGVKVTYTAVYPYCIIADLAIMKDAPLTMLHAGFGDIIGKYSALAEWKLANILIGEDYCALTASLVEEAVAKCANSAAGINLRTPEAILSIIEGLILAGMGIGMIGNSRPASGEEHRLAHTWEMINLQRGKETALHGNQVGIATEIILHIYQYLITIDIHKVYAAAKFKRFTREKWAGNLKQLFGEIAPQIIQQKLPDINFDEATRNLVAQNIVSKWDLLITNVFATLPSKAAYRQMMDRAEVRLTPLDLNFDRETFRLSLLAAKDIRQRFGLFQMLDDIGLLEEIAEMITEIYYE